MVNYYWLIKFMFFYAVKNDNSGYYGYFKNVDDGTILSYKLTTETIYYKKYEVNSKIQDSDIVDAFVWDIIPDQKKQRFRKYVCRFETLEKMKEEDSEQIYDADKELFSDYLLRHNRPMYTVYEIIKNKKEIHVKDLEFSKNQNHEFKKITIQFEFEKHPLEIGPIPSWDNGYYVEKFKKSKKELKFLNVQRITFIRLLIGSTKKEFKLINRELDGIKEFMKFIRNGGFDVIFIQNKNHLVYLYYRIMELDQSIEDEFFFTFNKTNIGSQMSRENRIWLTNLNLPCVFDEQTNIIRRCPDTYLTVRRTKYRTTDYDPIFFGYLTVSLSHLEKTKIISDIKELQDYCENIFDIKLETSRFTFVDFNLTEKNTTISRNLIKIFNDDILVPYKKIEIQGSYVGGHVSENEIGFYTSSEQDKIVDLDFEKFYPSIMINKNISPETVTKDPKKEKIYYSNPDFLRFMDKTERLGCIPKTLIKLISEREKNEKIAHETKEKDERILHLKKAAFYKKISNVMYGVLGSSYFYMGSVKLSSCVTSIGRKYHISLQSLLEKESIKVLNGDTDGYILKGAINKILKVSEQFQLETGMVLKIKNEFTHIFIRNKKNYFALTKGRVPVNKNVYSNSQSQLDYKVSKLIMEWWVSESPRIKNLVKNLNDLLENSEISDLRLPNHDYTIYEAFVNYEQLLFSVIKTAKSLISLVFENDQILDGVILQIEKIFKEWFKYKLILQKTK